MVEENVSLLYKMASLISHTPKSGICNILKSHYLMRCHKLTRSYALPNRQFSNNLRCSHCCNEWKLGQCETKVTPVARKKPRLCSKSKKTKEFHLRNNLEKICSFCRKTTIIPMEKPYHTKYGIQKDNPLKKPELVTKKANKRQLQVMSKNEVKVDVYCNSKDAFSLKNNIEPSSKKVVKNLTKNDKKKKDKFAGLCQTAVLSAGKFTQKKKADNKLNLFLKPLIIK